MNFKFTLLLIILSLGPNSTSFCFGQKQFYVHHSFIENKGQVFDQNNNSNDDVLFLCPLNGLNIQLRRTGFSYELINSVNTNEINAFSTSENLIRSSVNFNRIDVDFIEMNLKTEIIPEQKNTTYLNYFLNGKIISPVYSFQKVTYKNIFKNIDIEFILSENEISSFKYNIIIHPGGDIKNVRFLCRGQKEPVKINNDELLLSNDGGAIRESIPESYYNENPDEKVKVDYEIKGKEISFSANYIKSKTLVIDPSSNRIWGTYYGNTGMDFCNSTGVDDQKNVYLSGFTQNTTNIATSGIYQSTMNGTFDAFLVKFDSDGNRLWGTYFGGPDIESAYDIHVLPSGMIYMCGDSFSTINLASVGAHQTVYGGGINDAYLSKFTTNGQLIWSTYYGGTEHDVGQGVTVDSNGDVMMCGHTQSLDNIGTTGALNENFLGIVDAYVVKFDSSGNRLWGTYFGDNDDEEAFDISTDPLDNIIITGYTSSTNGISTIGSHQPLNGGFQDAFLAKLSSGGDNLIWSTFYGGLSNDQGTSVISDTSGTIFITGNTTSNNNISTLNAFQQLPGSADDAFLVRFDENGNRQWGTYFGGNDVDYINEIVFDTKYNLLFCGSTLSTDSISTSDAWQTGIGSINFYDAFFAKFNRSGFPFLATYYGGSDNDNGKSIAMDNGGHVYIAGETRSTDSIASAGSFMTNWTGNDDGFLVKFCLSPDPVINPVQDTICDGNSVVLSTTNSYFSYFWSDSSTFSTLNFSDTITGTYFFTVTVEDEYGCNATSDSISLVVDECVGLIENEPLLMPEIYPVPSGDFIQINFNGSQGNCSKEIALFSNLGKLIAVSNTNSPHYSVDLSSIASGIYFIRITTENQVFTARIIKQ